MNAKVPLLHKIGIWMDHSEAKCIHPELENSTFKIIRASSSGLQRNPGETGNATRLGNFRSTNNEAHKHHKDEQMIREYFEDLYNEIKNYDQLLIFGPTTAANEFFNYLLKKDNRLAEKIQLEKTDYIKDSEMLQIVKKHFINQHK